MCLKLNISLISAKQHHGIVLKAGAASNNALSEELVITLQRAFKDAMKHVSLLSPIVLHRRRLRMSQLQVTVLHPFCVCSTRRVAISTSRDRRRLPRPEAGCAPGGPSVPPRQSRSAPSAADTWAARRTAPLPDAAGKGVT